MTNLYFGCRAKRDIGHFLHVPDQHDHLRRISYSNDNPSPWKQLDGTLTPPSRVTTAHGAANLHHKDGWTALAMHDYSADSRGNSNAVFLFDRSLSYPEACAEAARVFPTVWARIQEHGPVRLIDVVGAVGR